MGTEIARPAQVLDLFDWATTIRTRSLHRLLVHQTHILAWSAVEIKLIVATALGDHLLDGFHDGQIQLPTLRSIQIANGVLGRKVSQKENVLRESGPQLGVS
jgi:uncharacterized membrane-anchored protein